MGQQEEEAVVNSEMFGPRLDHEEGVPRGFDDSLEGVQLMSVDQCENMREIDDSQLVGAPVIAGYAEVLARQEVPVQVMLGSEAVRSAATGNSEERMRKPIRGRPPRSQRRSTPAQPSPRRRRDEEDVCFICFDGGSLVLCDRRGCPKAYHPVCIKRDESFFRSKAKWNCGWHICSSCQKASHYMCYTCTFSLCKVCTKDADYFCVRGNKGFCGTCMQTVMLIENMPIGNKEVVQVDFDDKGSWEYLFKVYWIDLKQKLSLTLVELTKAKNPWKAGVALPPKVEFPGGFCNNSDEKVCSLDNSCRNLEANNSKRRKTRNQPYLGTSHDKSRNTTFYVDKDGTTMVHEPVHASTRNQGGESFGSKKWNLPKNQVGPASSVTSTWNNQAALQYESQPQGASESLLPPCSTVTELSIHDFETERLWHYHDPAGNIQGPFSMLQLHKWSTTGHFPSDLRVWRIKEKQEVSILLSDALDGRHSKVSVLICDNHLLPVDVRFPSDGVHKIMDAQSSASSDASCVDNKMVEVTWNSTQNDTSIHNNNDNESAQSNTRGSHSSSWTRHAHPVICNQQTEGSLKASDLSKDLEYGADQPQSHTSLPPPTPEEELRLTPSLQGTEGCEDEKWNDSQRGITINPPKATGSQSNIADGNWKREDSESYSGQASSVQGLEPPPVNNTSNGWVSGSGMVSLTMPIERSQHKQEIHFPDLWSRGGPKHSESGLEGQATENKQSMSLSVPVLDSGPSWSATSSLFGGGLQLPEVPGDAFGSSPTQTKPSVDKWDSNIVSSSSLRPVEVASDYAASPTSGSDQPTHSSALHQADGSSWHAFVPEPTEFCSLPDESVSDLLAEVEAMEALGYLGYPTSSISWWGIQGIRTRH